MSGWCVRIGGIGLVVGLGLGGPVLGKSPTPEFVVKSILQENLARKFSSRCTGIEFDHDGHNRHIRKLLGEYSNRGVNARNIFKNFAPIQPYRYQRHIAKFNAQHGLDRTSSIQDFCDAARAEMDARSPIGLMLRPAKGADE